jgi:hypothetical protein
MISPQQHLAVAHAKADHLRQAADAHRLAHRRAQPWRPVTGQRSVTLRLGSPADERQLARLAALDSSAPPAQPVLLAEVDGQLRAAIALAGGAVVADPFHPTADLIDLLRARTRQLDAAPRIRHFRRLRTWTRTGILAWR